MATHTFDLLFLARTPGQMPYRPIAHVYVKSFSRNDYGGIGAEYVGLREIEYEIEQLKSDLDEVQKKAVRKYAAAKRTGRG